ncbi:trimethyllysine dioxygenase, mitochondrial [Bombyx mandarina]|uniref:Trimethyllysine dioxygenase, mitochondrial n=1 Tax=Bombyx mandarina TaxID=7092 RepID=A0A6J2JGA5_BOMMA|nr:trimethyllysine dioxygenase, mitochondrial [Bombyx mandarina]
MEFSVGFNENSAKKIKNVIFVERTVRVNFENGPSIPFEDCWLRDHCRCTQCYHANTFQRAKHILELPDSKILTLQFDKNSLTIEWDDKHTTEFTADFLSQFDYKTWKNNRRLKPRLWRGCNVADRIAKVHVDKFLDSDDSSKEVFQSLLDYGVAFITGVQPSAEATETVCKALGGIQHTIFGATWEFTTVADHADTAYTNLPLAAHNDNIYWTEAAGLQILHCIEHTNGTGGETILVDGFYGATCLKEDHPEDYEFLTTYEIEGEYIENRHHFTHSAPVIQIDKNTEDIKQIRFNVYDRSAMAFRSGRDCRLYYRSLKNLARYYENKENQWIFKLVPGLVMVIDNFRLLHGRNGFTGRRVLCGAYVSRSDWLDKARSLNLIQ